MRAAPPTPRSSSSPRARLASPRALIAAAALLVALLLLAAMLALSGGGGGGGGNGGLGMRRRRALGDATPAPPAWAAAAACSAPASAAGVAPPARRAPRPWPPSSSATRLTVENVSESWRARPSRLVRVNCAEFGAFIPDGRMALPQPRGAGPEPTPIYASWTNPELVMHMHEFFATMEEGRWERTTLTVLRALLERAGGAAGDFSYIDFGSWIGPTALFAANFAPRVLALEPDPRPAGVLAANLLALPANAALAARMRVFHECIAKAAGTLQLRGNGDSRSRLDIAGIEASDEATFEVPCRSLPQFVREERARNLRLVKMDVEGAELDIFASLAPWLRALDAAALDAETSGDGDAVGGKPAFLLSLHAPFWAAPTDDQLLALWASVSLFGYVYEGDALRDISAGFRPGSATVREDQLHAMRRLINFTELVLVDEPLGADVLRAARS